MKLLTLIAALLIAAPATAHEYHVGDLTIEHPYAIATIGNAPVGGGYLEITNAGTQDDMLVAVTVAPEVAGLVQLHQMKMENGIMRMNAAEGGIPIPAGQTVTLGSGGLHVMFMRLPGGLAEGTKIPAILTFGKVGDVEVTFNVQARGAEADAHPGHGKQGD